MAITHATGTRNAMADAVVDRVDAGSGAGKLRILTSGGSTTLVDLPCSDPAFGAASSGTATAAAITTTDATAAGTAAEFRFLDSDNNIVFQGTVAESGGDLTITNTDINIGDPISVTSLTYSAPA